ncbi:hypothetical protein D6779_01385 [Candidatus Parcubacteria bacterium]|nr:MAG: hypothetical protein D6779_01385 [Candidatus Parcubacteria bacterium]
MIRSTFLETSLFTLFPPESNTPPVALALFSNPGQFQSTIVRMCLILGADFPSYRFPLSWKGEEA